MDIALGVLAGRYRLLAPLGAGGMGRVWLARDDVLHRDVAVKEVWPPSGLSAAEGEELHARTLREARAAARLSHSAVVQVHDVLHIDGASWIVMEYVPSRSLRQVIDEEGPLSPRQVAVIGLAVLTALDAAHRHGVLHRDVKPGNVLITAEGRVVLTDFGLAVMTDGEVTLPISGTIFGSPAYVAPERARDGSSTAHSDLWSLGATLYAAVEGRPPFDRPSPEETLRALATEEPDPMRRAGPLRPVLRGLLRKDPATRMDSRTAARALRKIAGGEELLLSVRSDPRTMPTPPTPVVEQSGRWRPRRVAAVATLVVLAAGAAGWAGVRAETAGSHARARAAATANRPPAAAPGQPAPTAGGQRPTGGDQGPYELPVGWVWHQDPAGFRIAVPQGWTQTRDGDTVTFHEPTGTRALTVGAWHPSSPDPVAAWRQLEGGTHLAGYQRVSIAAVPQFFRSCADWTYRYAADGVQYQEIQRGFTVAPGRSYVVAWRTSAFDWQLNQANFWLVMASFATE